jgi:hypothetical protein
MGTNKYMSLTKEDLLDKIREFYEENGKVPSSKEIKNPTSIVYYNRFETNKWNEILTLAGLFPVHEKGYSKEYLIEKLIEFTKKLGKIPTRQDFKNYNVSPCHDVYYKKFGSFEMALNEAGIKKFIPTEKRIENSKALIKKLGEALGRYPTVQEYDSQWDSNNALCRRDLDRKLNSKYNDICKEIIPNLKANIVHNGYNKDDIIKDILSCVKKSFPIIPTYSEYLELSGYGYTYRTILKFCGITYNEILKELGYIPRGTTTIRRSKDQMIYDFIKLYKELERIPTADEINSCKYCASHPTYASHFGGIEDICLICDIEYIPNENNGFGYITKDKNGDYCKSHAESVITNYFIDNAITYDKEYDYFKIPNFSKKDKRKLDWRIIYNDKVFYVEYFGCYTNSKNAKMQKSYVQKADKKVRDFKNNGLLDQCIFIYPKEYHTKTLEEIFNPYLERE